MTEPDLVGAGAVRRRYVLAGVAAAAAAAGAGVAWWRLQAAAPRGAAPPELWNSRFPRPDGGELALRSLRGRPLLINFWATWCPPCVEELPLLDRFSRVQAASGWQMVALAVDQPDAVRAFLRRQPIAMPVGLAGAEGLGLARQLGNPGGGLPFTVLIGADDGVLQRKIGKLTPQDLLAWAAVK